MDRVKAIIGASISVKQRLLDDPILVTAIRAVADEVVGCYARNGKVLFCGNGGSAADAQHLAAELSGRFYLDRDPLDAEALHVNTSYLTAVANEYGYEQIYSRLVRARGRQGDVLFGLSTSGNSANVVRALEAANQLGMVTVGLTGETGGKVKPVVQYLLNVPSVDTPRIQEAYLLIGHVICELVEQKKFGRRT